MFGMFKAALDRLFATRMDVNKIIALAIVMCGLVTCVAITQAQADVRTQVWLCGTLIVLVWIAVVHARR
ncbi:hypothetical protein GCM10027271_13040 [Saccharopolyspora gloriosae]|uniref:Uncharacterized protein n=1 Tax=Saccharopolyspora gloriosae TaxID=455344 RepID=A0A840NS75_9PSEU|nr:hypothetical protein [Saccharopolyspora gloriosae]MBB5072843.1 hypothetical protein [Saccharopolyspora gloriosae]